ncbi:MAG: hypothetical protein ABFD89_12745 [Bryobacteraceae bacterium]
MPIRLSDIPDKPIRLSDIPDTKPGLLERAVGIVTDPAKAVAETPRNLEIGFLETGESILRAVERRGVEKPIPDDVMRAAGFEPSGRPWKQPWLSRKAGEMASNVAATKKRAIRKLEPVTLKDAPIRRLTRPVVQNLPQYGTMFATSILSGTPLAGLALGAEMSAGSTYQQQMEKHGNAKVANTVADISGLAEAAGETLVFPRFIKGLSKGVPLREAITLIAENAGQEGATGFAQTFTESMGAQIAQGVDPKKAAKVAFEDGVKAVPENAWVGGAMAVLPGAGAYARAQQIANTPTPGPMVYTAGLDTSSAAGASWDAPEPLPPNASPYVDEAVPVPQSVDNLGRELAAEHGELPTPLQESPESEPQTELPATSERQPAEAVTPVQPQAKQPWETIPVSEIPYGDASDDYYYHVTTPENAERILKEGLRVGRKPSMAQGAYRQYSKGKLFLSERDSAHFWADRIEEHLQHESDDDIPSLVAVRIPKSDVGDVLGDELGTNDSGSKSYYITHDVPAVLTTIGPEGQPSAQGEGTAQPPAAPAGSETPEPEGDRPPISTRNVDTAQVRAEEGLPPLVGGQRRSLTEHQALWAEAAPSAEIVDAIADEMLKRPRALTPAEEQGFRLRIEGVRATYDRLVAEAKDLPAGSDALRDNINARKEQQNRNDKLTRATKMAGTEWSHTGLSRQNTLLEDETSPLAMVARAEEAKHDKLTDSERTDVETLAGKLKEQVEKAETRRKERVVKHANRAIKKGRNRYARMTEAEKDAELADLIEQIQKQPDNIDKLIYQAAMNLGSRPGVENVGDVAARLQEHLDKIDIYTLSDAIVGATRRTRVETDLLKQALASLRREAKTNVNLRTAIDDVLWHLREGTVPEPKRKLRNETVDIQALRETLAYYNEQLKDSEPARKAVIEGQIARLQAQLANDDFATPQEEMPVSEELRGLVEERNKLRAEVAKRKHKAQQQDITAKLKRLNDQIAELEQRVATGHYQKLPRPAIESGPEELDSMRAQKRALNRQLSEIARRQTALVNIQARIRTLREHLNAGTAPQKAPSTPAPDGLMRNLREVAAQLQKQLANTKAARKARLERALARVQAQIANGDYGPKLAEADPFELDPEIGKLQYQVAQARRELRKRIAKLDPWTEQLRREPLKAGARMLTQPFREVQAWKSAFDFSALMKQGGIALRSHPIRTLRRVPEAVRAMFDPKLAAQINYELMNGDRAWYYQRAGLDLTDYDGSLSAREEEIASRWIEGRKYLGAGLRASDRGFVTLLNMIRVDAFNAMEGAFAAEGGLSLDESRAIAMYVNVMTGRGSLAGLEKAAPVLNGVLWSPRYTLSRFQYKIGMPLLQRKASWRVRKAITKEYARYLTGVAVTWLLYRLAFGGEIEKDPRSADAGKIKVGNTRLDPLSGLAQWTVLLARQWTGHTKTRKGKVVPLNPADPDYPTYPGAATRMTVGGRFLRSKLGFFPGKFVDWWSGKDFVGQKWSWGHEIATAPIPLGFEDILRLMEDQGVPKGLAMETLNLTGDSVQVYDDEDDAPRRRSHRRRMLRRRARR